MMFYPVASLMAHECLIEWNGFKNFKSTDFFRLSQRRESNQMARKPPAMTHLTIVIFFASLSEEKAIRWQENLQR